MTVERTPALIDNPSGFSGGANASFPMGSQSFASGIRQLEAISLLQGGVNLQDEFDHWKGTAEDPGSDVYLPLAWDTHAKGYVRARLAKEEALAGGMLPPEIDKSRHITGDGMQYHLATNPLNPEDRSTARLIEAKAVEQLATFSLTGAGLDPAVLKEMKTALMRGSKIFEVGALANSLPGYSRGSTEILRDIVADTVTTDPEEPETLVFCSMVEPARAGLMRMLSDENFPQVGEATVLEETDYRYETTLIPLLVRPNNFVTNVYNRFLDAGSPARKRRDLESALFFAEPQIERGNTLHIPDEILDIRQHVIAEQQ